MKLKKFKTDIFAGITDTSIDFEDGLNVILGPNEAGKSTLVEAIFATIFQEGKLRLNTAVDKEFKERFMPYPEGDYINANLEFEVNQEKYTISKEWGDEHSDLLKLPDGQLIKSQKKIQEYLKELFNFGQATYGNVVFARQRDVKEAIQKIVSDDNIINTVSAFLRKAVMELEGISIERLKNKLDENLDQLIKKWDLNSNRPENPNRDINNPLKVGYGGIYELYIKLASTVQEMDKSREIEEKIKELSDQIKQLQEEREIVLKEINKLSKLENDIFKRGQIEPEIKRLEEKSSQLKKINQQWPLKEDQLKRNKKELQVLEKEIDKLKAEKIKAAEKVELEKVKKLLEKVDSLKLLKKEKEEKKENLPVINNSDIDQLEKIESRIREIEASLQASSLIAKVNKSSNDLIISRGLGEKETVTAGEEFKTNAYLHLEIEGILDLEIQSAEIDFQELKTEYQDKKEQLAKKLKQLLVKNISEAKLLKEKRENLKNEINNLEIKIDSLLDGKDYQELKAGLAKAGEMDSVRDIETIEKDLEQAEKKRIELMGDIRSITDLISNWQQEYGEADKLLDNLVDIQTELRSYQKELEELAALPDNFQSAEDFKNHLSKLRNEKETMDDDFYQKKESLSNLSNELGEQSYEELEILKEDYQKDF
ncbi:MAG: AAA family ATPase, partial [bacterium]